jgi:hypothetical protein
MYQHGVSCLNKKHSPHDNCSSFFDFSDKKLSHLFYSSVLHFYAFAHRAALYPPMLYPELDNIKFKYFKLFTAMAEKLDG